MQGKLKESRKLFTLWMYSVINVAHERAELSRFVLRNLHDILNILRRKCDTDILNFNCFSYECCCKKTENTQNISSYLILELFSKISNFRKKCMLENVSHWHGCWFFTVIFLWEKAISNRVGVLPVYIVS